MVHLKKFLIISALMIALFAFIKCSNYHQRDAGDVRGSQYAGSLTCIACHKDIANSYAHNNHFNASAKANYTYLKTIINASGDSIAFMHDQMVMLNKQDTAFYQTHYRNNEQVRSGKMDIAFGSGIKAQTFAYWKDSQLYELPLTYLTTQKIWTNSPGFPRDHPYFTRVIPSRCMECHTSFVQANQEREGNLLQVKEVYNPSSIIHGIDCERCHGPAAQHVKFQEENPTSKQAKFITSIKSLTRQQQLDMCSTCHAGDPVKLKSIFNFVPGDTLSNYYLFFKGGSGEPDVHGMQLQLLQLSKCFQLSKMTCMTCHAIHQAQDTESIINKCINCHQQVNHTIDIKATNNNCITCHMPLRPSKSLDFNNETEANNIKYMLRTHRIAVYNN